MPRSTKPSFLVAALALATITPTLAAQEIARTVPPGREVRQSKLLTLGKTDRWDLTVAAGEMLNCIVESSTFDPVLSLVDSDGDVPGRHDGEGTRSQLWLRMKVAGPVAFRIQGYEGRGGGKYSFYLQRYRTETIIPGNTVEHRFGREQWWHYRLQLKAGEILVPTASGHGRVTAVFDMRRKAPSAVLGGYRIAEDGLYFVRVEGGHERACRFTCSVARQRPMPADGAMADTIPPHGFDVWRLHLEAGTAYALHWQMPGPRLEVILPEQPTRHGPVFVWTGALDKGGSLRRWLVARQDCDLELLLRNRHAAAAPYHALMTAPNAELIDGEPVAGRLPLGGGEVYQLPTTPGQLLRVSMTSDTFDGQFDLWAPNGKVLAQCDDSGPLDRNPSLTFLVDKPGPYRILAFSPGGCAGGDYALRVDSIPVPELTLDQPHELQVAARGTAYCHLRLARSQEIWLSLRSHQFDVAVTVLAPDGRKLGTWEGGGVGTDVLTALQAPSTGRYTLQVHSRSGAGTCVVRVVRP